MILPMCAGGGADIFLDRAEQEDEQRLREVICERRSVGICCHNSPHDEAARPSLRTFHTASLGTWVNGRVAAGFRPRERFASVLGLGKDCYMPYAYPFLRVEEERRWMVLRRW